MHGHVSVPHFTIPIVSTHTNTRCNRWMFDCCRVPGYSGLDWSISYAKESDTGDSGHIVVFRKNRAWKVDTAKDGRILATSELEKSVLVPLLPSSLTWTRRQFQYIYDNTPYDYPGVGVLTASNRDVWAKVSYLPITSTPA
jgi:carnitine O-acetyltransferase